MLKNISKAVILAGGKGTRLSEQTKQIPKPLVKVGPYPIIIHIMRRLQSAGVKEFYILGGYLNEEIWAYLLKNIQPDTFPNPFSQDVLGLNLKKEILPNAKVYLINTGENSGTAERIKKVEKYIGGEPFIMTYGDSYSNINVTNVEDLLTENKIISICGIPYTERFGLMKVEKNGDVSEFKEKSESTTHFINGGYMCIKPEIFSIIKPEHEDFSKDTLESDELVNKISAHIHNGYWIAVDTQKDLDTINKDYNIHPEYFI